jgi:dienelactone hydrolase
MRIDRLLQSHRAAVHCTIGALVAWFAASLSADEFAAFQPPTVATETLPDTHPLEWNGDLAARMVAGIDRFLMRELDESVGRRSRHWNRDYSSPDAYAKAVAANRARLREIIGAADQRLPVSALELVETSSTPSLVADTERYRVHAVRWPVFEGVYGEGLLLEPKGDVRAQVVALPDADWTPEMLVGLAPGVPAESHFARQLAEAGCRVVVPVLIDRADTYSGNPRIRMTNQPHREYIYRQAYEMGRHLIGYEVQKVLALVDWFTAEQARFKQGEKGPRIGVAGYGEGGLLALYSAAVDPRIDVTLVSGYFQPREAVWHEPIYRNVWALLDEFGDAELASLIAPRWLVVEACRTPHVDGPPPARDGRSGAAPGVLATPSLASVQAECQRAQPYFERLKYELHLIKSGEDGDGPPGSEPALRSFGLGLGLFTPWDASPPPAPSDRRSDFDPAVRLKRQLDQLTEHTQRLMREGVFRRGELWADTLAKLSPENRDQWHEICAPLRAYFWEEVIGKPPPATLPPNPRTRLIYDEPKFKGYEVVLDVYPDVFAYGILLLPKDLKAGEKRPVVVCQHGLEGRPQLVADPNIKSVYHSYAAKLADRGFVVYAPQNPYIGRDDFRVLQRKANPLKQSLFSFIIRQHEVTLNWLKTLPYVDPERIGFYGLSYGGKTAMRVPAILDDYCLSICSADFNEWIWKNTSTTSRYSYIFTGEYEMFEFNLGNTFNYAEMGWLIAPRPFMVERGHNDGVAPDEWVAYEFAKIRRLFADLGIQDQTEIEFFNGPHEIHGVGTFDFLHRHLNWPKASGE